MSTTKSSFHPKTDDSSSGRTAPLGIYAETYSPSGTARVSAEGEILGVPRDSRTARAERFALKAFANRLLDKGHRTSKCMRWRVPNQEIQVLRGASTDRAYFHGLQVCAMPWTCPVCASKISERRRHEVARAMEQAHVLGLRVRLVTLTVPHGLGDDLGSMVDAMTKAWTRLWQGKAGMLLRLSLGLWGHIRALEVTHGANGFHPHFHALMFYHPEQTNDGQWEKLPGRWQTVAQRSGLPQPSMEHGCQIDDGTKAAQYVAKGVWGLESEVTKGHVKKGKRGSRTPFDLLRDYMKGDKQAGALWRTYAMSFEGRRQLYWSNGLKKLLAIADLTDEEIVHKPDDERSLLLASISDEAWLLIYRRKMESAVLDLAETSVDGLRRFLDWLKGGLS
uniref:Replication protein n=1 Tax=uncultured prokaryote TaxID=198431 RepID=A0A0H5Q284_9ZZZZ|nr:hypothetical protein [uncultured prokaryote]